MAIGSVGVEVVPDATDFWRRFEAATRAGAASAGRSAGRDFRRGLDEELKRPADIKVKADTRDARAEIATLRNDVNRGSGSMIKNLLALSPALVPLGAAAAAAGAEFVALGGTAALAVTGIKREIDSATPNGAAFAGIVNNMKNSLHQLQAVASAGVLTGFQKSANELQAQLPALSRIVAQQSVLLGSTTEHLTSGLIGGFQTFAPLLNQVGASVDRVAARFEAFATGPGGAHFGKVLSDDYAKVAPIVDDIATAIGDLVAASHGVGLGILTDLGLLARVLSSFPTPVLQVMITGFVAFRAAAAIQGVVTAASAAIATLGARFAVSGLQAQAAAAATAVASAETAAAAAASAATVAESQAVTAEAYAASQRAIAIATVGSEAALSGLALAAVQSAETQALAARTAATAAGAAAETQAAAVVSATQTQQAALARLATTQRTASAGFLGALGPIAALGAGVLLLGGLFGDSTQKTNAAASSLQSYTSALQASNGVLNDSVRTSVANTLASTKSFDAVSKMGISQRELTEAVIQGGPALKAVSNQIFDYGAAHKSAGFNTSLLVAGLQDEANKFKEAQKAANDTEAALLGIGSASGALGVALSNGNTALRAYVAAVKEFNSSADTAADRGKLIGEALRAANGDAISYQSTINATSKANQQLVTDFVNLKKGVLDLKTGTLDYHNAAAGPVLADLQSLQDANVKAAAAVYQHFVNTKGGAEAAGNAFSVYKKNTQGALTAIGEKLGLSGAALKKFTTQYFGIKNAGDLKKKIQLIGQDKVVEALKGILDDLDILAGKKPLIPIKADGSPAQNTVDGIKRVINEIRQNRVPNLTANTGPARDRIAYLQSLIDNMRGKSVDIVTRHRDINEKVTEVRTGGGSTQRIRRASGGPVYGPGSSTSDSIPARLSNGEFVINADAYSRNRSLVQAINSRAPGFKAGGEVGGYTGVDYSGKAGNGSKLNKSGSSKSGGSDNASIEYKLIGFDVSGKKFDNLKDARKAAVKAFAAQVNLGIKINTRELPALKAAAKKTGDDVRTAFGDIYSNLKDLGLKGGSGTAKRLGRENTALVRAVNTRNGIADKLKDAQDKFNELSGSVRDAITGSFDVTGAGTGFDGTSVVSGDSIVAQSKQAAARARLFVADIKALTGKLNGAYLQDLARKGPDALPQAEALVKLPKADLAVLNQSQATIGQQGASLGASVGNAFYGASIKTLTTTLATDNKVVAASFKTLSTDIRRFVDKADRRPVQLVTDGKVIAKIVNTENAKQKRRN